MDSSEFRAKLALQVSALTIDAMAVIVEFSGKVPFDAQHQVPGVLGLVFLNYLAFGLINK